MLHKKLTTAFISFIIAFSLSLNTVQAEETMSKEVPSVDKVVEVADTLIDISEASVGTISDQYYTGSEVKPNLIVTLNGIALEENKDYTVTYLNNIYLGKASAVVSGIGEYTGSLTVNFNIVLPSQGNVTGFKNSSITTSSYMLKWNAVPNASGYELEKYNNASKKWDKLADVSSTQYSVKNLSSAQKNKYRIRSFRIVGNEKIYSEYTKLYTSTLPKTINSLEISSVTTSGYTLKWNKISGADGYQIYLYNAHTKKWNLYKTTTSTNIKVKGRKSGQKNSFRVRAIVKTGDSVQNGEFFKKRFTTKPAKVKNYTLKNSGKGYITFKWKKVSNANKYQIWYSTQKNGKYKLLKEVGSKKTSVKIGNMPTGKNLYYKIRAVSKADKCKQNGEFSAKLQCLSFNKIDINKLLNSYSNSHTVKQLNAQGYKLSESRKNSLYNALTSLGGDTGYILYDIDSGSTVAYNANTYFETASTVKMPYVLYCLRTMDKGSPTLDTKLTYKPSDYNDGSSWIKSQPFYGQYTIKKVIELIGDYSDNCGYYMLQDCFGYTGYNKFISSLGCRTSVNEYTRWGYVSACDSAREWNNMWDYLQNGKYANFARDVFSTSCAANFRDQLGNRYTVYEKSGWTEVNYNETALVRAEHPYIVICLSTRTSAARMRNVAEISEAIHNEMWNYYGKFAK